MEEKKLTSYLIKKYNKLYADQMYIYKRLGGVGNESGKPDITGVVNGIRIEIEVKRPNTNREASKHQQYWLNLFKRLKCCTGLIRSEEEFLEVIKPFLRAD